MQMRTFTAGSEVIGTEMNYLCAEAGHYVSLTSINGGSVVSAPLQTRRTVRSACRQGNSRGLDIVLMGLLLAHISSVTSWNTAW